MVQTELGQHSKLDPGQAESFRWATPSAVCHVQSSWTEASGGCICEPGAGNHTQPLACAGIWDRACQACCRWITQTISGLQDQEAKAARRAAEVKAVADGGRNRAVAAQQAQREIERLRLEEQRLKLEQVGQGGAP